MLALSQEQLEMVYSAVAAPPPPWRGRLLAAISDQLTLIDAPTNRQILEVISAAKKSFALGSGLSRNAQDSM
jgi:hypothetical protein